MQGDIAFPSHIHYRWIPKFFATSHAWPIFYVNKIQSLLEKPKSTQSLLKFDVKIQKAQAGY
jgi:hypothetical protein